MLDLFSESLLLPNLTRSCDLDGFLSICNERKIKQEQIIVPAKDPFPELTRKQGSNPFMNPGYTEVTIIVEIPFVDSGHQQKKLSKILTRFNPAGMPYQQIIVRAFPEPEQYPMYILYEYFLESSDWLLIERKKDDVDMDPMADPIRMKHKSKPFEVYNGRGFAITIFDIERLSNKIIF